jgi:hypothetical protein
MRCRRALMIEVERGWDFSSLALACWSDECHNARLAKASAEIRAALLVPLSARPSHL